MNRSMSVAGTGTPARTVRAAEIATLVERDWRLLIGGALVPAEGGATFTVGDPFTQESLAEVPDASLADVDRAVAAAEAALPGWRATPALERADLVRRLADLVAEHSEELALLDTIDAGSPISNSRFDVEIALSQMRMYAGFALEMKGATIPASENLPLTLREPVGVVAKIFPYNHPLMFACRIAAPLVAGNPVVAKPPEAAPLSTLRLAELANEVFPPGVVNVVVGNGPAVPDRLVRHPAVRRIGFIGSEPTGRAIQRAAAESGVKHVTLELGGKNAMVVFDDADLEKAAAGAVAGMNFTWSGQSCGSNSRLLVHRSLHDRLVDRVVELVEARTVGDPLDEGSEQGTMINRTQFDKSMLYIDMALAEGAVVRTGGGRPKGPEFEGSLFVAPTVLVDVVHSARVAREEVFGPLLSVIPFDTEDEAVAIANSVEYGLTGSVWTKDLDRAVRVARALEAGFVWVNGSSQHFLNVPYGGVKASGVGGKEECLEELLSYTEEKVINIMV
ncbi:aldehyde dehydrogenase family protein [Nocardia farcinica]|uniref:aldehyde dehydrogenase family protein n=1 Tax=Nocardia farcinica TaxID=37329 RepID=UPI002456284E|nr:aldehyde dehydrogenase family protein [Nocardia farcinica]